MTHAILKGQSKKERSRIHELLTKGDLGHPGRASAKREHFLALLRTRYGYSDNEAVDEWERIPKSFHRTNKNVNNDFE